MEIHIEDETLSNVRPGVRNNAALPNEAMGGGSRLIPDLEDLVESMLEYVKTSLRRVDYSLTASSLRYGPRPVVHVHTVAKEDGSNVLQGNAKEIRNVSASRKRF